jgi:phospholipid/cholesterol/gamma-HCH transport system substrate-binding protein
MKELIVTFSIYKDINIPTNSLATINPNPLTLTKIEIKLGDATTYLKDQDTILTTPTKAYLEDVFGKVDPVVLAVKNAISSLDSLILSVKNVIDVNNKNNISGTLENLTKITESVLISSKSLEQMLNKDNGPLAKTLNDASSISQNIAANNEKISGIISNLNKTTSNLAQMDLQKTLVTLDSTINSLKNTITKINSTDGTVGMLLNDPTLYRNLTATSNKINVLLDDVRMHPKRYISISMFGKKDKEKPLSVPLPDTVSAPYINK